MQRRRWLSALAALLATLTLGLGGALAATERYALPGDNVFPEGIATDGTGAFYVGSTTDGTIYRGTVGSPDVTTFLPGGADGRTDVRGLKIDRRGRLFLAGGGTGQIFVYDGTSRGLLAKFTTGLTPSFVNDVTIAPNGDAYFTDSNSPAIYRVAADVTAPGAFSRWSDLSGSPIVYAQGFNLNGIAASDDGKYLVTVQSNTGKLFRVDIATRAIGEIDLGGQAVPGGDGLLLSGQTLRVMRNAAATLVTLQLAPDFGSATLVTTTTDPDFAFPTTFARSGDRLLVVNSQLDKRTANQPPTLPFTIVGVPIPGAAVAPAPGASPVPSPSPLPGLPSTGGGGMAPALSTPLVALAVLLGLLALVGVRHRRA